MKNKKGFTLVELLAVIVLLSLVIVIAIPLIQNSNKKIKEKALESKRETAQTALITWAQANERCFTKGDGTDCLTGIGFDCTESGDSLKCNVTYNDLASKNLIALDKENKVINPVDNTDMGEEKLTVCYNHKKKIFSYKCLDDSADIVIPDKPTTTTTTTTTTVPPNKQAFIYNGGSINIYMKQLSSSDTPDYITRNSTVKRFVRSATPAPSGTRTIRISTNTSPVEAVIWYNDGTIYVYSTAEELVIPGTTYMFSNMNSLKEADLSYFNMTNVTSFERMFYACESLENITFSSSGMPKLDSVQSMFELAKLNNTVITNLDLSNVTNMQRMFYGVVGTTIDMSKFNISKVVNLKNAFDNSTFDKVLFENVKTGDNANLFYLFGHAKINELSLKGFDTSKVTDMSGMFFYCTAPVIDVSNFNTSNVTNMRRMFKNTSATVLEIMIFYMLL